LRHAKRRAACKAVFQSRRIMMKISRIMTAALAAWAFCSSAHAAGECDKYTTSYDRTYCLAKLFIESDKELNEVYKALGKQINADVREDLKIIQANG